MFNLVKTKCDVSLALMIAVSPELSVDIKASFLHTFPPHVGGGNKMVACPGSVRIAAVSPHFLHTS